MDYAYNLSFDNKEMIDYGKEISSVLQDKITVTDEMEWENTVAWVLGADGTLLFSLPKGMGINLSYEKDILDKGIDTINSRYVLVQVDSALSDELKNNKAKILWEGDKIQLFCR